MSLRVHHLNCMSARQPGGRKDDRFAAHCLLAETGDGLVLVDTGLGLGDVLDPGLRLSKAFLSLLKPELRAEMTAIRQIERLGFRASDVRDIVLTHLDFDQAGGLDDFPRARVHMTAVERDNALRQRGWLDRQRYRPQQWSTRNRWVAYEMEAGDSWRGLPAQPLNGLPPELLLVPLPGHTCGHAGVAIDSDQGWLLLAGDAFFDPREIEAKPRCRLELRVYQRVLEQDRRARLASLQALRELRRTHQDVTVFCSHDAHAFERLAGRAANVPPEPRRHPGDPYVEKIVRRPADLPLAPRTAAPGIEVTDYDDYADDITFEPVPRSGDDEGIARPTP